MQTAGPVDTKRGASEYLLQNRQGFEARIFNYGGRLISLKVPDKAGNIENIVLGYRTLKEYLKGHPYFGAIIGRYAGRIENGKINLEGKTHFLSQNEASNHLHGGSKGFNNVIWNVESQTGSELTLSYLSKNGEEGYPGDLLVKVTYLLTEDALEINYEAVTDRSTIVNLTHHSFFNLNSGGSNPVNDHLLNIYAESFIPVSADMIPTGAFKPVAGTPFDFRSACSIGARIDEKNNQLKIAGGYDHCYVLNKKKKSLTLAASILEPQSGRKMEVYTTEICLQFYSGNFLDGSETGHHDQRYGFRSAFCLEAQHFPNAFDYPEYPKAVLGTGEVYRQTTIYKFSVID